jgi:hypothetical protein
MKTDETKQSEFTAKAEKEAEEMYPLDKGSYARAVISRGIWIEASQWAFEQLTKK